MPLRARIGVAFLVAAAAIYGGWNWWIATRTWVPLDTPVSLARGHFRSPEFKINVETGFWIYVEVELKPDEEGVSCLIGYTSDYCEKHGVHELRASWTLSDAGKVVAQGSTDKFQAVRGGMVTRARGLGEFAVPTGGHYVLDIDFPDDNARFDAGHPRLIAQNWSWDFFDAQPLIFVLATLLGAIGAALVVSGIAEPILKRRNEIISLTAPGPRPGAPATEAAEPERKAVPSKPGLPRTAWLGMALVLVGVISFVVVGRWVGTRIFVPVDMPVSLAKGHIRTGPFRINVEGGYSIWIDFDQNTYFDPQCSSYLLLQTTWVLYRDGHVADQWNGPPLHDGYLLGFDATKGVYDLDVEVLSDARCLNANRPRLKVVTSRADYDFYATVLLWPATLCAVIGVSLLVLAWREGFGMRAEQTASVTGAASVGQNFQWAQRLPLRRPISGLPGFGLAGGLIFAIWAMLMMALLAYLHVTPKGLPVHLLKPGEGPEKSDAWTEPLIVWVKDAGPGQTPNLYVNSRQVSWADLDHALKQELGRRREWVVYVGGDDAVAYENVATVIDVARGNQARVILITRNVAPPRSPRR